MSATPPTVLDRSFLKIYRCFNHGQKICICFLQNPFFFFFFFFFLLLLFFSLFHFFNLDFFAWFQVCSRDLCEHNYSFSFIRILLKLHIYLNHGLKICMWFLQNLDVIFFFFKFFTFLT